MVAQRIRFAGYGYEDRLIFHFSARARRPGRSSHSLFTGAATKNTTAWPHRVEIRPTPPCRLYAIIWSGWGQRLKLRKMQPHPPFHVNGSEFVKEHPRPGLPRAASTKFDGTTPNRLAPGPGRGGWCPGMQVDPWIVDVPGSVTGSTTITYQGLFNGSCARPSSPARALCIKMQSYLVISR